MSIIRHRLPTINEEINFSASGAQAFHDSIQFVEDPILPNILRLSINCKTLDFYNLLYLRHNFHILTPDFPVKRFAGTS